MLVERLPQRPGCRTAESVGTPPSPQQHAEDDLSRACRPAPAWPSSDMGDRFLLRYRYPDRSLQAAFPLWRVESTDARRVGWLPVGTEVSYWSLPDGSDPRSLPLAERFAGSLATAVRRWEGNDVLRVCFRDRPYQVIHFWNQGEFAGWYVNFESPGQWTDDTIETRDWHLDLWIHPDGEPAWKDEEEAEVAARFGHVSTSELALARRAGEAIIDDLDTWLRDVGDWRKFRPPVRWAPLSLPTEWATSSP